MEKRPRRHRAVARALVVRGAVASLPAFLSGSFLATSCRPPAAPFAVLEPPVGRSRRHRSCRRFRRASSCRTRPQTSPFRSSFLLSALRGGLDRCGVVVACGATSAPSAICFRGATPTPSLPWFFWVAVEGSEAPSAIDAPDKNPAPFGRSVQVRPPVWQSVPGGFVRSSLRHAPPRTPLRYALHTLPALRPPQAAAMRQ
mgnify:CR=1 FL=1